jgi:hypothetical protein
MDSVVHPENHIPISVVRTCRSSYHNFNDKVTHKIVPVPNHHVMAIYGRVEMKSRILNLGTRWRWVVSFTPQPLYPQVNFLRYPLDRRFLSRSGRCGVEEDLLLLPGIEPRPSNPQPVPIPTELWRSFINNVTWRPKAGIVKSEETTS